MRYKIHAVLETGDGDRDVVLQVDGRDVRRWESAHNASWLKHTDTSLTDLAELAFHAAVRTGEYDGDMQSWLDICVGVEDVRSPVEVEADSRPTRKGRGGRRASA